MKKQDKDTIKTKICSFCKEEKSIEEFHKKTNFYSRCKPCKSQYDKEHYRLNKERRLKQSNDYNKIKTKDKNWYKRECKYMKDRRKKLPYIFRWRDIFNRTFQQVKNNKKSYTTEKYMGYSAEEFRIFIESQFTQDQNWGNISIDHKIPMTWFKKTTPLNLVNDLKNLQILTLKENIAKSNYYSSEIDLDYYKDIITFIKNKYKNKIVYEISPRNS
jgi:hypothetical protein